MRKKRLLWMIDRLGPGGAENLMPGILGNITEFEQRVCVLQEKHGNPIGKELEALGIPVDLLRIQNLRSPRNLPRILKYLQKQRPDILHTQLEFSNTLGSFAARLYGIPSLTTLHTLDNPHKKEKSYWRLKLMWISLKYFAARVIAVSESTRQHHIMIAGIPSKKIITIHNGINLHPFSKTKPAEIKALRTELDIPDGKRILISIAVLRQPKGIQTMLQAIPEIIKREPNLLYLIIGDGAYAQELKNLTHLLDIDKYVRFGGFRKDIANCLALSEFFVLPTFNDAFPTVLIEAMAAEKALIASNVGGVPEILQDGLNGILVPPANVEKLTSACLKLLTDKQTLNAYAATGKTIANQNFNVHKQAKKLERLYQEILAHYEK